MSTSQLETLSVGRTRARARWGVVAAIAALLAIFLSGLVGAIPASAANFGIQIGYDGTGQGTAAACAITGAGGDNSATDGVVCTNDNVRYDWFYNVSAGESLTATYTQTLPSGFSWQSNNLLFCENGPDYQATGTISGQTLTCTLTFAPGNARAGSLGMVATVSPDVPSGTVLQAPLSVTVGSTTTQYTPNPITVVSRARVDLSKRIGLYSQGPGVYNGQSGAVLRVNVAGAQLNSPNAKGIAALVSPFTFVDDLAGMPAGTVLFTPGDCRLAPLAGFPDVKGVAAGTWNCAQSAPGQPITIEVTGANTGGGPVQVSPAANQTTVFAGDYFLFVPESSIPAGGVTASDQLRGFDPEAAGGTSNFGSAADATGWEPGGYPDDTCTSPANNNNCASVVLYPSSGDNVTTYKGLYSETGGNLPSHPSTGAQLVPGQKFVAKLTTVLPSVATTDFVMCDAFDPTREQIRDDVPVTVTQSGGSGTLAPYVIEYGTQPVGNLFSKSCGVAGDSVTDGPWYSSIAAAGGPSAVTTVRVTFTGSMTSLSLDVSVPMTNVLTTPGDNSIDTLWYSANGAPYVNRGLGNYTVSDNILTVSKSTTGGQAASNALAGEVVPFHIGSTISTPTVNGSAPRVVTITDSLPTCFINPVPSAATIADWNIEVTPADFGPDGLSCTPDDVSGITLTFTTKNPITPNTPVPDIDYTVKIDNNTPDGVQKANTAVISAEGNIQNIEQRYSNSFTTVRTASQIDITKLVDQPIVEVAPDVIGFTVQWSNTMASNVGESQWIDVLPYNGDGRGTDFDGSLALASLDLAGGNGVIVEYTSRPPALIDTDPYAASNLAGGSTVWCATFGGAGCPATIADTTAIRVTIPSFAPGQVGNVHYTMQPTGNSEGDVYQNHTGIGRAEELPLEVPISNQVRVDVVASSAGELVWWDDNQDGVKDAAETGIPNVTVNLLDSAGDIIDSAVTDSNGLYRFSNYHSGDYRVVVDTSTLPLSDVIKNTYDLDNGTSSPNSDSGLFPLGVDTDRSDVNFGYVIVDDINASRFYRTQISAQTVGSTASVTDQVTFTPAATGGTYTWTLLGPVAPNAGACVSLDWTGAATVGTNSFVVTGPGIVTTPPVQLNAPGCYTYVGSYVLDGIPVGPVVDGPGIPAETVLVSANVPTVGTVASTNNNRPGATASDAVTISGLTSDSTYTWTLYGPVAPVAGSCAAVDWTNSPPALATGSFAVTTSQASYTTPSTTVSAVGCYSYGGSLAPTGTTSQVDLAPGVPSESFTISANAPTVTTEASTNVTAPLQSVSDEVTITGLGSQSATYSWTLLGPVPAVANSCDTVNWAGAPVFDAGSQVVTGDGTYQTSSTQLGNAGCYTYTGALAATPTSDAATLPAGVPAETIRVDAVTPTVATEASTNAANPPVDVTDEITIAGLGDQQTDYSWSLLGPVAPVADSCSAVNWTGAAVLDSGTIEIDGDGVYTSDASTIAEVGCYTYTGTLAASGTSNTVVHAAGDPAETILVTAGTPVVTTQASVNSANPGDTVSDAVTVSGLGAETPSYTWSLLGPVAAVADSCDAVDWTGAPVYDTGSVTASEGTFSTPSSTLGGAGCYTYIGVLAATDTTEQVILAPGVPEETVLVDALSPAVTTQASVNVAAPRTSVSDSVVVSGLGDYDATYSWTLLGPVAAVAGSCDAVDWTGAPAYDGGTVAVSGDGTYVTTATSLEAVGCYTYVGTLGATPASDEVVLGAGIPEETVLVNANVGAATTQASTNSAGPGTAVTDSVVVTGLDGETADYNWTLLGPIAPVADSCAAVDWTGAPVFDSGSFQVVGNGTYTTTASTLVAAGCYTYTGDLAGTATSLGVSLAAGDPAETVLIDSAIPGLTTQATPQTGAPGVTVSDTVVLTGPIPAGTAYSWSLVGPIAPVADSCVSLDWTGAAVVASGSFTVDGAGTYATPNSTLTAVGCYSYAGSLAGSVSTDPVVQNPGVPAETVRVDTYLPSVVTTASGSTGVAGDEFTDSIVVTGLNGAETEYDWTLLGPVAPVDDACEAVDWTGAAVADSGTLAIDGDGTYVTPATSAEAVGCYTYTGSLAASTTTDAVELAAGDPAETFIVEPYDPAVTTRASESEGLPGESFTDAVEISGLADVTTTYSWTLVQAEPDGAGQCVAIDWAADGDVIDSGEFEVTGDGTYTTDATVVTDAACYSYTGQLEATATSLGVELPAGDPLETFLIEPFEPAISTEASVLTAEPGDVITDSITISSFGIDEALYEWQLLGPVEPVLGECTTVNWTAAPVFDTGSFTVQPGTSDYGTTESVIGLPGCYTYTGALAATDSSLAAVHAAGDPAETFLVTALSPIVSTQVSNGQTQLETRVSDSIIIEGTRGATIEATWVLYGPIATTTDCSAVAWDDAEVAFEGVITVDGDGTYTTPSVLPADLGCYSFEVTLGETDTTVAVTHEVGQSSETTHVVPRPTALALTGSTVTTIIGAGAVLFGLGLTALLIARSRRTGRRSTGA
ncbi:SdrD B-like domain-containing protein [Salinibacterium soli]|uniref:SdrD B-like domain-containing protein n=1 Tax=Antiquaquibacter soli TaxID=3064523 RepID=A0ABT9BKM6_9MICO|nr:SdrD B-like domain-containing protein [Protaetiibacter sp. WY-16]MDO7881002.1 SdrD B-like domain-containing protein [Protaetiibacter sp. WY-16]